MARESFGFAYPARKVARVPKAPERFSAGEVFTGSLRVLFRNAVPFGIITAVLGIPYIVMVLTGLAPAPFIYRVTAMDIHVGMQGFNWNATPAGIVLALTYLLVQCAITYGTFQSLLRKPIVLGRSFARGLGAAIKVIPAGIVMLVFVGLVVALAMIVSFLVPFLGFLVLPATAIGLFVLYVMWWVVVPVIVVEGGFIECFRRSRSLTKGNRWGIVGLFLIVFVVEVVMSLAITGLAMAAGRALGEALAIVVVLISVAFTAVLKAVAYYKLRAGMEGINTEQLAAVFD